MEPAAFINQARELYLGQFRAFVAEQKQLFPTGAAEKKYALSHDTDIFRKTYCVDFVSDAGASDGSAPAVPELVPVEVLDFAPIIGSYGAAALRIEHFRWDDVAIYHDASDPSEGLGPWFDHWFDVKALRYDPASDVEGVIHSLLVKPGKVSADLGTAPTQAFWHLLEVIENSGAKSIRITASRDEAGAG